MARRTQSKILGAALTLLMVSNLGCREELGAESFSTAPVEGTLRLNGQPVESGWVEFLPIDGAVGIPCSARLGPGGHFRAPEVAVGWNQVGISNAPIGRDLLHLFHPLGSPIRREVPTEGSKIELELLEEAVKAR